MPIMNVLVPTLTCGHRHLSLFSIYLGVALQVHRVGVCLSWLLSIGLIGRTITGPSVLRVSCVPGDTRWSLNPSVSNPCSLSWSPGLHKVFSGPPPHPQAHEVKPGNSVPGGPCLFTYSLFLLVSAGLGTPEGPGHGPQGQLMQRVPARRTHHPRGGTSLPVSSHSVLVV